MTYRLYLTVLVAVVAIAQMTASAQRVWVVRDSVAAAPVPAAVSHLTASRTAAAGGVAREMETPPPPPAPALVSERAGPDAPCDTVTTTAAPCAALLATEGLGATHPVAPSLEPVRKDGR